jgi:HSP20 family protein
MMWRNMYRRPAWPGRVMWRGLPNMQDEMNFLLGGTRGPNHVRFPAINSWQNDEEIILTAEVPGVAPDSIDISIVGETLTLSGSRIDDELPEGVEFHRRERGHGEFSRTFELPYKVDVDSVEAQFQNGVLRLIMPRVAEEKPRKIEIKSID